MKTFRDETGRGWVASAREEDTPRHHGRWYLVMHPADRESEVLVIPEVRWQTAATAARTLRTMSDFELRRRLLSARGRTVAPAAASASGAAAPRPRSSASAG